ncbi:hypothetical protein GCM10010310_01530 [Streptomyces violaceolatus]|uniref:Uncharacterized protein n=1 Tax=Streptomyces violaceolatus TaxID=67378 RepID=A0ABN3S458_9ACTN
MDRIGGRTRYPTGALQTCTSRVNGRAAKSGQALGACGRKSSGASAIASGRGPSANRPRNQTDTVPR